MLRSPFRHSSFGVRHSGRLGRLILICLLAALILGAVFWLGGTDEGRRFLTREHLRHLGTASRGWVDAHPVASAVLFLAAYVACALLLLPVWWLQLLAGFGFGLWAGLAGVMAASTCGALATAGVARWLGDEWVRARFDARSGRAGERPGMLGRAFALMGRNGLLVVLICRLSYPVPYGVSNYLFGLTGVKLWDIAVGTAVGGVPVYAGWVAAGARPEWLGRWEFWASVVGGNLVILGGLLAGTRQRRLDKMTKPV
ncbi:MAG: hypothetical protein JWO31_3167 [Phycisphaerales bacterium]|nr:hypothetical protein [Phycisphaerales bacterium]